MASQHLLTAQTSDGFSSAVTVNGKYTLHVRGTFDRATVRVHATPANTDNYMFLGEPQFAHKGVATFELSGKIKLEVLNAGANTEIDAWLDGPHT
jgi:hypothetical protein